MMADRMGEREGCVLESGIDFCVLSFSSHYGRTRQGRVFLTVMLFPLRVSCFISLYKNRTPSQK